MRRSMIAVLFVASAIPAMAQTNMKPAMPGPLPSIHQIRRLIPPHPLLAQIALPKARPKSRIESKGFKNVSHLKKDDTGVWRGQAMQNDKTMNVSVDFQGNVVAQ